jgi:hypothetical protein
VHATPTTPISSAASHHDAVVRDGLADHGRVRDSGAMLGMWRGRVNEESSDTRRKSKSCHFKRSLILRSVRTRSKLAIIVRNQSHPYN